MTKHKLDNRNGTFYLHDQMLLVFYPEGDCDTVGPKTKKALLHRALYDAYQCSDVLKDGDTIALPSGKEIARCEGVHVNLIE